MKHHRNQQPEENTRAHTRLALISLAALILSVTTASAQEKFPAITAWDYETYGGGFNIHWGDLSSNGSVILPNPLTGKLSNSVDDPWLRVRTEGTLFYSNTSRYANGQYSSGYSTTPILETESHYYQPYLNAIPAAPQYYEHLFQHQSIDLPAYQYEHWKALFLSKNLPYYWADASGAIWGTDRDPASATYGQVVMKPFDGWFSIFPTDPLYWDPYLQYAFIDTLDQQPPAADGSNMALITSQAGQTHSRGLLFIANDIEFKGNANPVANQTLLDPDGLPFVVRPDDSIPPPNSFYINHRGFFLSWGRIITSGKRTIYGAIFGQKNFSGNGTLEIWYDYRTESTINAIDVPIPDVSFASETSSVSEALGTATVTVTLDQPADPLGSSVQYSLLAGGTAATPDDFSLLGTGTLSFAPGVQAQDISIIIVDDTELEGDETVHLQLSNPVNATIVSPGIHVLTILDDEATPTPTPSPTPVCDAPGDENHDCIVDLGEVNQAIMAYRGWIPPPSTVDTDGNGVVDLLELNAVIANYRGDIPVVTPAPSPTPTGTPTPTPTPTATPSPTPDGGCNIPGDENGDCIVDLQEFNSVVAAYRYGDPAPVSADTDGDGFISLFELNAVMIAYRSIP